MSVSVCVCNKKRYSSKHALTNIHTQVYLHNN